MQLDKMRVIDAVELLRPQKPAKLYLLIKDYMEKEQSLDDFFEQEKPAVRIHDVQNEECEACSA